MTTKAITLRNYRTASTPVLEEEADSLAKLVNHPEADYSDPAVVQAGALLDAIDDELNAREDEEQHPDSPSLGDAGLHLGSYGS